MVLRQEAGVLTWKQLTEPQQQTVQAIVTSVRAMLEGAPPRPGRAEEAGFLPRIDGRRTNHVFLIDGARGSGKSSVLVTLLDAWAQAVRAGTGTSEQAAGVAHPSWPEALRPAVPARVIPLGLIDLQPLDPATNLLVHVVGQMLPLIETLEKQDLAGSRDESLEDVPREVPCRQAWRDFLDAAAAGGDEPLDRRRDALSLESYVAELEITERNRLQIAPAFRRLVDALWDGFQEWQERDDSQGPVFLLAIDDADLNPRKSAELLMLLRWLWHPRLAFVLTGDSALFLEMIEVQLGRAVEDSSSLHGRRLQDMAPAILDKVIPASQRFLLPGVRRHERRRALESALRLHGGERAALRAGPLLALLEGNGQQLDAVPDTLRKLANLAQRLMPAHTLAAQMGVLLRDAVHDQEDGTAAADSLLELAETKAGALTVDLGWKRELWALAATRTTTMGIAEGAAEAVRVTVEMTLGRATPRRGRVAAHADAGPVSPRYLGAILLALDAEEHDPQQVAVHGMQSILERDPLVAVMLEIPEIELGWELPLWNDMQRYRRALRVWLDAGPQRAAQMDEGVSWLAAVYLIAVLAAEGRNARVPEPGDVIDWAGLAALVAEVARTCRDAQSRTWALGTAPLLGAPESGLPVSIANAWTAAVERAMKAHELTATWLDKTRKLRAGRLFMAQGSEVRREDLVYDLAEIDSQHGGYRLSEILERS